MVVGEDTTCREGTELVLHPTGIGAYSKETNQVSSHFELHMLNIAMKLH